MLFETLFQAASGGEVNGVVVVPPEQRPALVKIRDLGLPADCLFCQPEGEDEGSW